MLNKKTKNHLKVILLVSLLLITAISIQSTFAASIDNNNNNEKYNEDIDKNTAEIKNPIKNSITIRNSIIISKNNILNSTSSAKSNKKNSINEIIIGKKLKSVSKTKLESGCCSVVLQVNNSSFAYGYRRDSTYAASLYVKKVKLYGIEGLKEYKTTNTYFFHTLILKNGWFVGAGGSDNPSVNKYLEDLGAKMAYKGVITSSYMSMAMKKVRSLGIGHFIIKSPKGKVGVAIYNGGSKLSIFRLNSGEYISIPNSPWSFRKGTYTVKKSSPVDAAIYIAGTDKFGINRRNIMVYNVANIKSKIAIKNNSTNSSKKSSTNKNTDNTTNKTTNKITNKITYQTITKTKINIWTTNDDGRYVGRNTGWKYDNIFYKGKKIAGSSIPKIPNKKYIGEVILK